MKSIKSSLHFNSELLCHYEVQTLPDTHLNEQFSAAVTQKFMETNLYLKRLDLQLDK